MPTRITLTDKTNLVVDEAPTDVIDQLSGSDPGWPAFHVTSGSLSGREVWVNRDHVLHLHEERERSRTPTSF